MNRHSSSAKLLPRAQTSISTVAAIAAAANSSHPAAPWSPRVRLIWGVAREGVASATDGSLGDLFEDRLARVLGLEHHQVAGPAQDLADKPGGSGIRDLDHHGPVRQLLDHSPLLAQPAGALGRDPDPCHARGRDLAVGHPALDAGDLLHLRAWLEPLRSQNRPLDPIELEVADALLAEVI